MSFLKKLSVGSYVLIFAVILAITGLIIGVASGAGEEFPMNQIPLIVFFTILAILLVGVVLYASVKFGDKSWWISAVMFAVVILLAMCFYLVFMGKTALMGTIWFSELDRGYKAAEDALAAGVVSMVLYLVSSIIIAVCVFFSLSKKTV